MATAKVAPTPRRIVCVEDELCEFESFRHVAVDLLGLNVEVVRVNAGDALSMMTASAATSFYPDVLVLDYHRPGHNGLALLRDLRSRDLPQVQVVFLTQERTNAAIRREADKYGAVECFYAAISFDDFVAAVGQVCSYGRRER